MTNTEEYNKEEVTKIIKALHTFASAYRNKESGMIKALVEVLVEKGLVTAADFERLNK